MGRDTAPLLKTRGVMAKIKTLLELLEQCECGCDEPLGECGHEKCDECGEISHSCAGCGHNYCECSEEEWAVGENGTTYCSQQCADAFGLL
jgi:hypothetical protein